jgi:hypothetical protein
VTAHRDAAETSLNGKGTKLVRLETGIHGHRPIVQCDRVPSEEPARGGQESARQEVPFQVDNNHTPARHRLHGREQLCHSAILEVMQEQMAHHHVETACREWEMKSIGGQLRGRCITHVQNPLIERSDPRVGVASFEGISHIARGGAYIQDRELVTLRVEAGGHLGQNLVSSEPAVNAPQIGEVAMRLFLAGMVQKLGSNDTRQQGLP